MSTPTVIANLSSQVAGLVPTVAQLPRGVIAINHTDGKLYFRYDASSGSKASVVWTTDTLTRVSQLTNDAGYLASNTTAHINLTGGLGVTNGLTADTLTVTNLTVTGTATGVGSGGGTSANITATTVTTSGIVTVTAATSGDFGTTNDNAQIVVSNPTQSSSANAMISFNVINQLAGKIGISPAQGGIVIGGWSLPANAFLVDTGGSISASNTVFAGRGTQNQLVLTGSGANTAVTLSAAGGDAAISIAYVPKGSGSNIFTGEVVGTYGSNGGQFRLLATSGTPGVILRNDGGTFYILKTPASSQTGTWDSTRPFSLNLSTGLVSMASGLTVSGGHTVTGGATLSGGLTLDSAVASGGMTAAAMAISAPSGTTRQMVFYSSGSARWVIRTDAASETGGNVGSDFYIDRYSDGGAYLGTSMGVSRASGYVSIYTGGQALGGFAIDNLTVTNNAQVNSGLTVSGNAVVSGQVNIGTNAYVGGSVQATNYMYTPTYVCTSPASGNFNPTGNAAYGAVLGGGNVNCYNISGYPAAQLGTTQTANIVTLFCAGQVVGAIYTNGSAVAYNTASDYRLKDNVTPLTDALARVNQLAVKRFTYKNTPGEVQDGFLAHDVAAVAPHAVTGAKDGQTKDGKPVHQMLDQSKLVPLAMAAIQELSQQVKALQQHVADLTAALHAR